MLLKTGQKFKSDYYFGDVRDFYYGESRLGSIKNSMINTGALSLGLDISRLYRFISKSVGGASYPGINMRRDTPKLFKTALAYVFSDYWEKMRGHT